MDAVQAANPGGRGGAVGREQAVEPEFVLGQAVDQTAAPAPFTTLCDGMTALGEQSYAHDAS
ncbi:hypothetical protein GCM10010195_11110 [Kitasatospora griseola]|nr:hypothetical protein GCM10010195_11110 [Kitasatospora griseola]